MTDQLAELRKRKKKIHKLLNEIGDLGIDDKDPRGGHNRKSTEDHKSDGTYNSTRHRPRLILSEVSARPERTQGIDGAKWIRNSADEQALAAGCWFDERQAEYVADWFRTHLRHCIGEWTGKPFELMDWQREEVVYPLFGWQRLDDRGRIVRRHKRTFIEIPKKNGKSTLASGVGLYMMVGEGVDGSEVYSYATDKDQASIVHGNAIRMVEASEQLQYFLRVNYTTKHIYNHKHSLCYRAESSRAASSQGKLGNCAIIDELHAWYGTELWDSLRYLGVNWPEPLHFIITTAGDDTEHLCHKQLEYARGVERGEIADQELMVFIREAAADADLKDPAVQKHANPSLGITISAEDLNKHIDQAASNPREMTALKRYRFNIWSQGQGQWIDPADWALCELPLDVEGMSCVGGLDLARKWDLCALPLVFDGADSQHVRVWCWLPEERAKALKQFVDFEKWAEEGWLTLTPGGVADYNQIEDDIVRIFEQYQPDRFAYDEKYAEEITQRIVDRTGVERIAFGQSMTNFAGPSARFEQLVLAQDIKHDGNPLLTWQVGNVTVKEDPDGNIRPVRQKRGDYKTIDSVVAIVMALGLAAIDHEVELDYYDSHPLEMG